MGSCGRSTFAPRGSATPRGTARHCIFIELGGAISPMDCWDFKETRWTPKDLDVTEVSRGLYMSRTLFPQLSQNMHRVALVRSLQAPELIHFNGQYHTPDRAVAEPGHGARGSGVRQRDRVRAGSEAPRQRHVPDLHQHQPDQGARGIDRRRVPADVGDRARSGSQHGVRGLRRQPRRRQPGAGRALAAAHRAGEDQRRPAGGDGPAGRRLPDLLRRGVPPAERSALAGGVQGERGGQAALRLGRVRAGLHPGAQPAEAGRRHAIRLRLRRRPAGITTAASSTRTPSGITTAPARGSTKA